MFVAALASPGATLLNKVGEAWFCVVLCGFQGRLEGVTWPFSLAVAGCRSLSLSLLMFLTFRGPSLRTPPGQE